MKKTLLVLLSIIAVACNNSKEANKSAENEIEAAAQIEEVDKEVEFVMEFKTNKNANIVFMMENIPVNEFQTKNIHIVEKVTPTTGFDKIEGNFGPNNISSKMIIALGNEELKEMEIKSMQFSYGGNIVNITPNDLEKYLAFSKFSPFDSITKKIKTVRIDNVHYPRIYVRRKLWDDLKVNFN